MPAPLSRRRFLASAGAALGLAPLAAGCGDDTVRASSCDGYASLDTAALKTRQALGYVDVSPDPAQLCTGCLFYQTPAPGAACGGCQLFAGPVAPAGYCASWVAGPAS